MRKLIIIICLLGVGFSADCQFRLKYKKDKKEKQVVTDSSGNVIETDKKGKHKKKGGDWDKKIKSSDQKAWDSIPEPVGLVSDFEKIFKNEQIDHLDSLITEFEKKTTIEIAIITVDSASVNGEFFNELPPLVGKTWGIGKPDKHNGIVIGVSVGYHKVSVFLDDGAQQYMDDGDANAIIKHTVIPQFKQAKYYDGVLGLLVEMMKLISSRSVDEPPPKKS